MAVSAGIGGLMSVAGVMMAMRVQVATLEADIKWIKEHLRELRAKAED